MSTFLRGSRLIEICTPSISYDEQVQSASHAFDQQMYEIIDDTGQVIMIPNIMGIEDSNLIDILAWQFHVDFYDPTRDLEFRKTLVQRSIVWHMTKGTVALVEEVINTFFPGAAYLQEWFEYMHPFPPNYPIDDPLAFYMDFSSSNVNLPGDKFTINGHGLVNGDAIQFVAAGALPVPITQGVYYYAVNVTTNSFQISLTAGGTPVILTTTGSGTNHIWKGAGSWHDRYRFRVVINDEVVDPEQEAQMLVLIDRYKPVSRWLESILRPKTSKCYAYVGIVAQQYITRVSNAAHLR